MSPALVPAILLGLVGIAMLTADEETRNALLVAMTETGIINGWRFHDHPSTADTVTAPSWLAKAPMPRPRSRTTIA